MNHRVRDLYKRFLISGRYYPGGWISIRDRVKNSFFTNSHLLEEIEIKRAVAKGRYWVRELNAITTLHKYRTMKRRYGSFD